jgi:hypothetical protein
MKIAIDLCIASSLSGFVFVVVTARAVPAAAFGWAWVACFRGRGCAIIGNVTSSIAAEFRRYKSLGEAAIAQVNEADLAKAAGEDNSIAVIVWHIGGNLRSRFTDFLTSDGEKPDHVPPL